MCSNHLRQGALSRPEGAVRGAEYDGRVKNPEELYELTPAADEVPAGLPLVAGLTRFADAGAAVTQLGK